MPWGRGNDQKRTIYQKTCDSQSYELERTRKGKPLSYSEKKKTSEKETRQTRDNESLIRGKKKKGGAQLQRKRSTKRKRSSDIEENKGDSVNIKLWHKRANSLSKLQCVP